MNAETTLRIRAQERSYEFFYKYMVEEAKCERLRRALNRGESAVPRDVLLDRLEEGLGMK